VKPSGSYSSAMLAHISASSDERLSLYISALCRGLQASSRGMTVPEVEVTVRARIVERSVTFRAWCTSWRKVARQASHHAAGDCSSREAALSGKAHSCAEKMVPFSLTSTVRQPWVPTSIPMKEAALLGIPVSLFKCIARLFPPFVQRGVSRLRRRFHDLGGFRQMLRLSQRLIADEGAAYHRRLPVAVPDLDFLVQQAGDELPQGTALDAASASPDMILVVSADLAKDLIIFPYAAGNIPKGGKYEAAPG